MRTYPDDFASIIHSKTAVEEKDGYTFITKFIPDDEREHVLDPRVYEIGVKKAQRIAGLKKKFSLAGDRFRPDKISYDLTIDPIDCDEFLIKVKDDHMIDVFSYRRADDKEKIPAFVYAHGGGWSTGDYKLYANQMKLVAEKGHCMVFFPEYRLSPETPYPGAIDDVEACIAYVHDHADELNIDINNIVISGDSAGGNLIYACLLRETGKYVRKAIGLYPAVDQTAIGERDYVQWSYDLYPVIEEQKEIAYSRIGKIAKGFEKVYPEKSFYIQGKTSLKNPEVSPIYASDEQLKKFPEMVIVACEYDFLRMENEAFAKKLAALGIPTTLVEYRGMDHGFLDSLGIVPAAEELCWLMAEETNR